ncbi:hypothetical protein ACM25N_02640 [Roseovarius sp. C7]|uniref:hypothetical protein n=1 Tax=Roseovarius sp. C7 TaxID=3398643 RepID=UPI0039F4B140
MPAFLAAAAAALTLSLPALPGSGAMKASDEGYYASGWPIALTEAACDGDELCLTKLANCGPRNAHCSAGIALCEVKRGEKLRRSHPCPIDRVAGRAGRVILMTMPSGAVRTLLFQSNGFTSIDGRPARKLSRHCLEDLTRAVTTCATPLKTRADFDAWAARSE